MHVLLEDQVCVSLVLQSSGYNATCCKCLCCCDEQYGTALMYACDEGHHECVSILAANGADVNAVGEVGAEG